MSRPTRQAGQHYADVVRRLVRRLHDEAAPSLPSDRRRLVAAVEQALNARARRRVVARRAVALVGGVAAAAAALLFAPQILRGPRGALEARLAPRALTVLVADDAGAATASVGGQAPVPVRRGMAVRQGLRLVAPVSGEVRVGTNDGTLLTLEPRSDMTVTEAGETQRFALRAGAVRARVSRLFAGERFIVDTADAQVEVHGTVFRVAVVAAQPACGGGTTTRVSVDEGVVTVRRNGNETRVAPGEVWPAGCGTDVAATGGEPTLAPSVGQSTTASRSPAGRLASGGSRDDRRRRAAVDPAAAERPEPAPATAPPTPAPTPSASPAPLAPLAAASALAVENDLFAAAVRARHEGQLAEAARLFAKLCDDHPRSPLAESAAVQRMRVLTTIDPAEGTRAASEYVARFPGGFARAEAQALIDRARP